MNASSTDPQDGTEVGSDGERARLVVLLGKKATEDLAWLVETEEMNKTSVTNRAIQVLRKILESQSNGGSVTINDPSQAGPQTLLIL